MHRVKRTDVKNLVHPWSKVAELAFKIHKANLHWILFAPVAWATKSQWDVIFKCSSDPNQEASISRLHDCRGLFMQRREERTDKCCMLFSHFGLIISHFCSHTTYCPTEVTSQDEILLTSIVNSAHDKLNHYTKKSFLLSWKRQQVSPLTPPSILVQLPGT